MGVRSGQDTVAVRLGGGHGASAYPNPVKATQPWNEYDPVRVPGIGGTSSVFPDVTGMDGIRIRPQVAVCTGKLAVLDSSCSGDPETTLPSVPITQLMPVVIHQGVHSKYTLDTSGARGSAGSKKDGQVMGSNLPTHMGAD